MEVRRLFFREMGTYSDLYSRRYTTEFSRRELNQLDELTMGGKEFRPTVISGLATRIVRPTADVSRRDRVGIDNGWGTRRFMFIMEAVVNRSSTTTTLEVITGYTDHNERFSRNGHIDMDTVLYFNSTFTLRTMQVLGRHGRQETNNIMNASQIIARRQMPDFEGGAVGTVTMRPEDLFRSQTGVPEFRELANDIGFRDMRNVMERPLRASLRENTMSATYLTKAVTALRDSAESDFIGGDDLDQRLIDARGMVKEPILQSRRVFEDLARETQIMESGRVTYGELLAMNPDLDRIAEVNFNDSRYDMDHRNNSAGWDGRNLESVAATIIAHAIPNIMMECMYAQVTFVSTNLTPTGRFETGVSVLVPYIADTDIDENFNRLLAKITHELMPGLMINEDMTVDVTVSCSIYADTIIEISVDGGYHERFVFPTFCDSLATPVVTDDHEHLRSLAGDIISIHDELGNMENTNRSRTQTQASIDIRTDFRSLVRTKSGGHL